MSSRYSHVSSFQLEPAETILKCAIHSWDHPEDPAAVPLTARVFAEASKSDQHNPVAFHLRAMNMLYEGLKLDSTIVIVPSTAVESMLQGGLAGLTAMTMGNGQEAATNGKNGKYVESDPDTALAEGGAMTARKHDVESEGANPRDHTHGRHHLLKHAHRDWRVWIAVGLMLALILVYEISNNLALRPGKRASQPTPEAIAP
jgi:hypothetical protein